MYRKQATKFVEHHRVRSTNEKALRSGGLFEQHAAGTYWAAGAALVLAGAGALLLEAG